MMYKIYTNLSSTAHDSLSYDFITHSIQVSSLWLMAHVLLLIILIRSLYKSSLYASFS